jgi:3-deoxy-manno-octulosonate cytidylyltransferase (CMP-KDO synthetase)
MAATRLPGKPLLKIGDRPVVEWVYRRTVSAGIFDRVVVATPDDEIATVVDRFGGEVVVTRDDHPTGTDRVAEVSERLTDFDVVANVQGDQPFVDSAMLEALIRPYFDGDQPDMVTIGAPLTRDAFDDPNTVKVVCDRRSNALYFSRSAIPYGYSFDGGFDCVHHHLGLYAFAREFLAAYSTLPATPLETSERLEQLRALEHGARVRVVVVPAARLIEINTVDDLLRAQHHAEDLA